MLRINVPYIEISSKPVDFLCSTARQALATFAFKVLSLFCCL